MSLTNGTGTCSLMANQLPLGSYPLTATYSGSDAFLTSADTSQTLNVVKEPTTTSLTLSAGTISVGAEQTERFTVQVRPTISGTPTGNVTVKANGTALSTVTLVNGTGSFTLASRQLARSTYQITAVYNGDNTYASSTLSPPQTLVVTR
jgi:hypothetical protein